MPNYSPINYGPVAQNAQATSTARNIQTGGSLAPLVQQPGDTWPSVSKDGVELKEVFKGPSQILKNIPLRDITDGTTVLYKRIEVGKTRSECDVGEGNGWVVRFDPPASLREDGDWVIKSVEIVEQSAGDHSIMTITYGGEKTSSEEDPSHDPDTDDDVITDSVHWGMRNEPQEFSIYSYCTDSASGRYTASGYPGGDYGFGIQRWNIEAWLNEPNPDVRGSFQYMDYTNGSTTGLSIGEKRFAKLLQMGITGVQRHYPVLTCTWSAKSLGLQKKIGDRLDHYFTVAQIIAATPGGSIPFALPDHRVWLLSQDDAEWEKKGKVYTRTMSWVGVEEAGKVPELYGEEGAASDTARWQFGCGANIEA